MDYTAILESADYSRNGDAWEKTDGDIIFRVTPKNKGFDLECTIESAGNVCKLQISKSDWSSFRITECAIQETFTELFLNAQVRQVLGEGGMFDGMDSMLDGMFGKADDKSRPKGASDRRTFTYEAADLLGQETNGEIEAVSSEDALTKIRNLGYFPTRIRENGSPGAETAAAARAIQAEVADVMQQSITYLRRRNRVVQWCRDHTRTLLLAGIIVLGVLLI